MVDYLEVEDVERFHQMIAERAEEFGTGGGPYGVKDRGALESAVHRPRTGFGGHEKYETIFEKAGALAHGISKGHVFKNGNKRTALLSMAAFLRLNGYDFRIHPRDFFMMSDWAEVALNGFEILLGNNPDLLIPVAWEVYGEAFLSLLQYIELEEDQEVGWNGAMACSMRREVAWDWEIGNFKNLVIQPEEESVASVAAKLTSFLAKTFDRLSVKGLTVGSSQQRRVDGTWLFGTSKAVVAYSDGLPEPEQQFVTGAAMVPMMIGPKARDLTTRIEEAYEATEQIFEGFEREDVSQERARKHVGFVESLRPEVEGFSATMTVEEDGDSTEYEVALVCAVSALVADEMEEVAFHSISPAFQFAEERPKFEEWEKEDREGFVDKMRAEFENLVETAIEAKSNIVSGLLEEAFEAMRKARKAHGITHKPGLDESMPNRSGTMDLAADFMVRVVEEDIEPERIAEWLENQVVAVPDEDEATRHL